VHVWGANFFVAVVGLHFLVKLFTRAYRRPRELTWVSGMVLLFLALGFGFSGYLLPWNELSYFATLVGTQIPGTIPVAGDWVVHLLRGGAYVTNDTLVRFFAGHVMFLPLALAPVLALHLGLIQAQGMSLPLGLSKEKIQGERPFFSEFILIDGCIWLVAFGAIVTLAVLLPAEVGTKADLLEQTPAGIKPEWYFLFMFQTLKHVPETVGVLCFALGAVFLLLVPFLDRKAMREEKSSGFTAVFVLLAVYAAVFQIWAAAAPGVKHASAEPASEGASIAGSLLTLVIIWIVIGFLVFYLRQLFRENTRIRGMYR
jgi:cytochrome b6